jgi:cbb3-type cytochrome oxidase maturation protein
MENFLYLIPIALCLGGVALMAFMWSLKTGQYDDLAGAAVRILNDHDGPLRGGETGTKNPARPER